MKKYAVMKKNSRGTFYFVNGYLPHWLYAKDTIPDRATFELRGEARDIQRQVGGKVVPVEVQSVSS